MTPFDKYVDEDVLAPVADSAPRVVHLTDRDVVYPKGPRRGVPARCDCTVGRQGFLHSIRLVIRR